MKTEYKYLKFEEIPFTGKTKKYQCSNKKVGGELGIIKWFPSWRQYCFFPTTQAVYSAGCLNDIADFIKELKEEK